MQEAHLNSVHLDLGRREEFRRARERILNSCGAATVQCQLQDVPAQAPPDRTIAQAHSGSAVLHLIDNAGRRYPLKIGIHTVGRLPDNDVVICDAHASRRHCTIVVHVTNACEMHDVASKNGTFLNGERVTISQELKEGDQIRVGDLVFTLRCTGKPASEGTQVDVPA